MAESEERSRGGAPIPREMSPPPRRRPHAHRASTIGEDVLAAAAADDHQAHAVRSHLIEYILVALFTTGFGTCGLIELFSAH